MSDGTSDGGDTGLDDSSTEGKQKVMVVDCRGSIDISAQSERKRDDWASTSLTSSLRLAISLLT